MKRALSVIIPAYNEESAIAPVIERVRQAVGESAEIIVVDDGSTDQSGPAARSAGARVIRHRGNRGYGAALKTGTAAASHNTIVIIDADGTYPAARIPDLLAALDRADMVVGARTGSHVRIPWARRPAKWLLNRLANYLTRSTIPDLNSGLRVFRRDVVMQYFPILPDQFSWTTTITLAMHCDNYAVAYVPIDYHQRTGRSKIVPRDAGSFLVLILRTIVLFRPLRIFLPIVLLCLIYGFTKASVDMVRDPNISASAILAFMSALLILLIGMVADALATRLGRLLPNTVRGVLQGDEELGREDGDNGAN